MAKYRVLVTVDTTMSCQIEVEATSVEEAESNALAIARNQTDVPVWEQDDGFASDPYIADEGNSAEEITNGA